MAAAPTENVSVDKLTGEFLSCSLCLDKYIEPKLLSCQHTFCTPCLKQYVTNLGNPLSINCPLCRQATMIPNGNIQSLKNNFWVESLISFIVKEEKLQTIIKGRSEWPGTSVAKRCEVCEEDKPTDMFCNKCDLWMCKGCAKTHNKLPATKDHSTLSVEVVVKKARDKLTDAEKELNMLLEAIDSHYQDALLTQQHLSEQGEQTANNIELTFTKILNVLETKKMNLLESLAIQISKLGSQLETKVAQTEHNKFQVEMALEFVKETKSSSDAWHITSMLEDVQNLRESTTYMNLPNVQTEKTKFEFFAVDNLIKDVTLSAVGSLSFPFSDPKDMPWFPTDTQTSGTILHHLTNKFYVTGIAVARSGNVFVASNCDSFVMFKKGIAIPERENLFGTRPWGVALSPSSEVVSTDCGINDGCGSVNIFQIDGTFKTQIAHGLSMPRGVAVDKHGRIYVCDEMDRCLYIMTPTGRVVNIIKRNGDGNFIFEAPRFVSVHSDGIVAVSDNARAVKIFDAEFKEKRCYQSPFPGSEFWDVHCGLNGNIFVADWNHGVHVISAECKFQGFLRTSPLRLLESTSLTLNPIDNSLIVGNSNGEVICVK